MSLLWIDDVAPPDPVVGFARNRGWEVLTADIDEAAAAATEHRPDAILLGVVDADFAEPRAAAPATPLLYCPPTTTADGVDAAVAAGVDAVLAQDADAWSVEALAARVDDANSTAEGLGEAVVSDGSGATRDRGSAGGPPAATATAEPTPDERPPSRGMLSVGERGRISYVGEHAAALLDCEASALLGRDLTEALPWSDLDRLDRGTTDLDADDGSVSTVERLMPANRWLELTARPTKDGATVTLEELDAEARRRVVLDRLHGVSRRLFAAATPEAVAKVACEAAHDVLGLELVTVRLYDPADEQLRAVATTDGVDELMPERLPYDVGEGTAGEVFERGSSQRLTDIDDEGFGRIESAICLPFDDHGTISIGSTAPDAFDEADVSLARLLSTTVSSALDRAQRDAQLRRREAVLESIHGMVFALDEHRMVDYVSRPLADRIGVSRESLVGRHVVEFVDIDELPAAESRIESGDPLSLDLDIDPADGESFPARVELSVLDRTEHGESLVGVVEDRSTLAATQGDLRQQHERLWTLFENLPDPVIDAEHTEDGPVVQAANDAFAEVFGCDREAVIGEPIDDVLDSPAGEPMGSMPPEAINEQVREGEVTGAKVQRETERGARTFLFRGIPYAQDGSVRAFGIYTDVTDIERRERHVKVLDRLLRHNLRNDLGVVIGRAENVLERSEDPAVRREAIELVEAANGLIDVSDTAKRIRRIIEEPAAERSQTAVATLFDRVATEARGEYPDATIRVESADDELEILATSDLRLAVEELIENAVVHGNDEPTIELRAEPFASAPGEWVDLLVVDDGPGIPETERAAVTGDRDITQLQHGSGLGLWLVRWAVESVGGDVGFERRDGRTVVRLRLRRPDEDPRS